MTDPVHSENDPSESATIIAALAAHGTWWLRVLGLIGAWQFLLPWPIDHLIRRFAPKSKIESSAWITLGLAIWIAFWLLGVNLESIERNYSTGISQTLLGGAFLLFTTMSVSVAMPGDAVIKSVLRGQPKFAVEFIGPFFWGFLWGVLGAVLMFVMPGVTHLFGASSPNLATALRSAFAGIALYGALMELHALFFTIRVFTFGMVQMSSVLAEEEAAKAAKKARKAAKKAKNAAKGPELQLRAPTASDEVAMDEHEPESDSAESKARPSGHLRSQ